MFLFNFVSFAVVRNCQVMTLMVRQMVYAMEKRQRKERIVSVNLYLIPNTHLIYCLMQGNGVIKVAPYSL